MDGETHRKIAPVFTAGATYLTIATRGYHPVTMLATVGVASAISVLSANWADADLAARSKPVPAIWAGTKVGRYFGIRSAVVVDKRNPNKTKTVYLYRNKRYTKTHGLGMRIMATIFRLTGVRDHRVWQSHSPVLWIPIILFTYALYMTTLGDKNIIFSILSAVPLGLGYGYLSHLFGDALTYKGLPLLPEFKLLWKLPFIGDSLHKVNNTFSSMQVAKVGFAKASNKTWNNIVFLACIIGVGYILAPAQMNMMFSILWSFLKGITISLGNLLKHLTSNYLN